MSDAAPADLQRALQITIEMLEAAVGSNWDRVCQLDVERQRQLRKCGTASLSSDDRQIVATMLKHNQSLMVHADAARAILQQQLDRHQYNHRALQTYISSSSSR
jgi:hypothetical protein